MTDDRPVTQGFVYELVNQLRDHIDVKHASLREFISVRATEIEHRLDAHVADDNAVKDRVLTIEIERAGEKATAVRHGTWAGIIAGGTMTGVIEALKRLWH